MAVERCHILGSNIDNGDIICAKNGTSCVLNESNFTNINLNIMILGNNIQHGSTMLII